MTDPYAEYKTDEAPSDKLDTLAAMAESWQEAMEEVSKCTEALQRAQARVREIEERSIPEIMDDIEMEKFTTKSGLTLEIKEVVRCSIPKAIQPKAFEWLRENGHSRLIKRTLKVDFAMGEEELAQQFKDGCAQSLPDLEVDDRETIANPSLVKFVKEKAEAGEELPTDLFPVFRQRVAKIK